MYWTRGFTSSVCFTTLMLMIGSSWKVGWSKVIKKSHTNKERKSRNEFEEDETEEVETFDDETGQIVCDLNSQALEGNILSEVHNDVINRQNSILTSYLVKIRKFQHHMKECA